MELDEQARLIHQPVRLKIMGLVYKHRDVAFTRARDVLGLTDGNLASHANRLEEAGLLEGRDALTSDGFEKRYRITEAGSRAFKRYLGQLKGFLEGVDVGAGVEQAAVDPAPDGAEADVP